MDFSPLLNLKETFHTVRFQHLAKPQLFFHNLQVLEMCQNHIFGHADTQTRQGRNNKNDQNGCWMMLDKTLASISSKEKSVGATSGLASIFNKLLHLKESETSPKRIYKTSNAGHFLGKLWWFEVPRNISMIFGRLLLANHVRVMLRVGATWGMEAKAAAGHQTQQALRTSRKNSEPGIRRLVDTLPVKVSKSRKSYQWLSIEVSIYEFHIQLMFFRPFGPGILRKPHSSPRHSSSAETFWDESRAMEFQLGTGVRKKNELGSRFGFSWICWFTLPLGDWHLEEGTCDTNGQQLLPCLGMIKKHRSVEVYLIYCIDQTEWSNSSVANIQKIQHDLQHRKHHTSEKSTLGFASPNLATHLDPSQCRYLEAKSVEQGKSRDNRALDKRKRFASWSTHRVTLEKLFFGLAHRGSGEAAWQEQL